MFCAKTHNRGFVSPTDHKTPIVPRRGVPFGIVASDKKGFAIRESCAHPLTRLPAKTENTSRVFRFVCVRLVASAAKLLSATCVRNAEKSAAGRFQIWRSVVEVLIARF